MKAYYYYERDEKRRPVVTHCLLNDDGLLALGIAKCSKKDFPIKKRGREIAYQRALRAFMYDCSKMDKCRTFWKQISHDFVFDHLTPVDRRILRIDG